MDRMYQYFVLAMLLCFGVDSSAQVITKLERGATVRIKAPSLSEGYIKGDVTGFDETTVTILRRKSNEKQTINLLGVEKLQVDRGTHVGEGALIGFLVGVGVGVILTYKIVGRGGDENDYWPELFVPPVAGTGLMLGAIAGTRHSWETVPLHEE